MKIIDYYILAIKYWLQGDTWKQAKATSKSIIYWNTYE